MRPVGTLVLQPGQCTHFFGWMSPETKMSSELLVVALGGSREEGVPPPQNFCLDQCYEFLLVQLIDVNMNRLHLNVNRLQKERPHIPSVAVFDAVLKRRKVAFSSHNKTDQKTVWVESSWHMKTLPGCHMLLSPH